MTHKILRDTYVASLIAIPETAETCYTHCEVEFRLPTSFYCKLLMKQGRICFRIYVFRGIAVVLFKNCEILKWPKIWCGLAYFFPKIIYISTWKKLSTIILIHTYIECSKILADSKDYWILSTLSGYTHICNYLEVMKSCVYCRHTELQKYIGIHMQICGQTQPLRKANFICRNKILEVYSKEECRWI